ncbi:hypothetical protein M9458_047343, partial [Cirrhinus mrigala]
MIVSRGEALALARCFCVRLPKANYPTHPGELDRISTESTPPLCSVRMNYGSH